MNRKELDKMLILHAKWLRQEKYGMKADFRGADLREADLRGVNLREADLRGVNLYGADLRWADLHWADLRGVNLRGTNLRWANLYGADLRGVNLYGVNLYGADLRKADLRWADLRWADLRGADIYEAAFYAVNLYETRGVPPIACPEKGEFIGFKKAYYTKGGGDVIVELLIRKTAKRSSATTRKCRCSKAKVLSITTLDGIPMKDAVARSGYDPKFTYTVGQTVEVKDFDPDRWDECAPGIHFFITRQEAVDWQ